MRNKCQTGLNVVLLFLLWVWIRRCFLQVLRDDRGAIIHFTAIAAFLVMTFFTMSFDLAKISAYKMQMQNAADSAALEMAVWQARGLNAVQHMNDEVYDIDAAVLGVYVAAATASSASHALLLIPFAGVALFWAAQIAAALLAYAGLAAHTLSMPLLDSMRDLYVVGSNTVGYISANELAQRNGAQPIEKVIKQFINGAEDPGSTVRQGTTKGTDGSLGKSLATWFSKNIGNNFTAVGVNLDWRNGPVPLILPLEKKTAKAIKRSGGRYITELPLLTRKNPATIALVRWLQVANRLVPPVGTGLWLWEDWYYLSKAPYDFGPPPGHSQQLSPMIWFTGGNLKDISLISRYFLVKEADITVTAYAVAQAKHANVVRRNPESRDGEGVRADAVLVPFDNKHRNILQKGFGKILLH